LGAIISSQLGEDVPDVAFHRVFSNREHRCNLFITIAGGDPVALGVLRLIASKFFRREKDDYIRNE
jgi:hypothetical protein